MPRNKEQTEQIRAESREKILKTALHLFAEKGYDGCNVSDIARTAGMSQGNIYWYFPSKKEIFKAVLLEGFTSLGNTISDAASDEIPALQKLDIFLDRFYALMKEPEGGDFLTIVVSLAARGDLSEIFADFGLSTHQIGAGYHQSLNAILAQGQAEGVVMREVDPNLLSTFVFSFINGLMTMYPDEWKDIPEAVIRQAIQRLLGMTPR
jgi:AcrR family transcriptional regulator